MLARLWLAISVRQEHRGGNQGIQVCVEAGAREPADCKRSRLPPDPDEGLSGLHTEQESNAER